MRFIQRESAGAQVITCHQFRACSAKKKPTSEGSGESVSLTYSLLRFIQRESAGAQVITCHQFSACSAKKKTKASPNQGCSKRVVAPPPNSGVKKRKIHGR